MFYLIIWCILFPDLLQYLISWAHVGEATSAANLNDSEISAKLWTVTWLEEQVKDIWSLIFYFEVYIFISLSTRTRSFSVCGYTAIVNLLREFKFVLTIYSERLSLLQFSTNRDVTGVTAYCDPAPFYSSRPGGHLTKCDVLEVFFWVLFKLSDWRELLDTHLPTEPIPVRRHPYLPHKFKASSFLLCNVVNYYYFDNPTNRTDTGSQIRYRQYQSTFLTTSESLCDDSSRRVLSSSLWMPTCSDCHSSL